MRNKILQVLSFFHTLLHCREYYDEAMEYRWRFFSTYCQVCNSPHPVDANFCPECGQEIRSNGELYDDAWEEYYRQEQPQGPFEEALAFGLTQEEELDEGWEVFEEVYEVWFTESPCGHRGYE